MYNRAEYTFLRCKRFVMNFEGISGKNPDKKTGAWPTQVSMVDGEFMDYKNKIIFEVCPESLEVPLNLPEFTKKFNLLQRETIHLT